MTADTPSRGVLLRLGTGRAPGGVFRAVSVHVWQVSRPPNAISSVSLATRLCTDSGTVPHELPC